MRRTFAVVPLLVVASLVALLPGPSRCPAEPRAPVHPGRARGRGCRASTARSTSRLGPAPPRWTRSRSRSRNLGQPASERTEVRIVYDAAPSPATSAVTAPFDAAALRLVATEMRRDSDRLFDEDNFQVILDTFKDSRNGYMFVTTPLGAKLEQQIFDEGEGGGARHHLERQPQLGWRVGRRRRAITGDGWTAEMAIPTQHAALSRQRRADLGHQFHAPHPPQERARSTGRRSRRPTRLTRVSLAGELRGPAGAEPRPRI